MAWRPLLCLLLVPALSGGSLAQEGAEALYLLPPEREGDVLRFSADPPNGTGSVLVEPQYRTLDTTEWRWVSVGTPEDWTLQAGETVRITLWIENLDRVYPNTEVPEDPAHLGAARVTASLFEGEGRETIVSATMYHRPPTPPGAGAVKVVLEASVAADRSIEATQSAPFGLFVEVAAQTTADSILGIWVGDGTPSSVAIPGFPYDAFRLWEAEDEAETACLEKIQRQEPCVTEEASTEPDPEARALPGPGVVLAVAVLFVVACLPRRRR